MLVGRFFFEMVPYQVTFVHFQGVKRVASIYPFDPPVTRFLQGGGDTSNDPTLLSSMLLRKYCHQCCGMWRKHRFVGNFHWLQMDVPKSKGSLRKHLTTWIITASVEGPQTNPNFPPTSLEVYIYIKIWFQEDPIFVMHFFPVDKK